MTPPQMFTARLADKRQLTPKFIHYYFELTQPNRIQFDAGQYVSIGIPNAGGIRRSYSICSSPSTNHAIELLVDTSPQGAGTKYLDSIQFGQEMQCLAPMGKFVIAPEATGPLIFVGTGSGLAPFRSMIMDQLQNKRTTQPITLFWGLRYVEDLFWTDEFEEWMQSFPNFKFHPVISRAMDQWPLCRGRVTDCLTVHELPPQADYYLCGNAGMLQDTLKLLEQKQVRPENVHHEKFF